MLGSAGSSSVGMGEGVGRTNCRQRSESNTPLHCSFSSTSTRPTLAAVLHLFSKHMAAPSLLITPSLSSPLHIMIHHFDHFLTKALNSSALLAASLHMLCTPSSLFLPRLASQCWGGHSNSHALQFKLSSCSWFTFYVPASSQSRLLLATSGCRTCTSADMTFLDATAGRMGSPSPSYPESPDSFLIRILQSAAQVLLTLLAGHSHVVAALFVDSPVATVFLCELSPATFQLLLLSLSHLTALSGHTHSPFLSPVSRIVPIT